MRSEGHLDWLAVTFPADTSLTTLLPGGLGELPFADEGAGAHGYRVRQVNEIGSILYSDGSERQGLHLVNGGEALVNIRSEKVTDQQVCTHVRDHYGRPTRLDVAIDIFEGQLTRDNLVNFFTAGRAYTVARSGALTKELTTPEGTFYLGSRTSQRFFRAYDKGAQMHEPQAWLRLELECKKLQAQAMLQALCNNPDQRPVINRAIKNYVDYPDIPEWCEVLADDNAVIPQVPRKMTNTLRWLLAQVAPALAKYERDHPSELVRQSFLTAWRIALSSLMKDDGPNDDGDDALQYLNEVS